MRISDWSSDVCSSDLRRHHHRERLAVAGEGDRNLGGHHVAGLGDASVAAAQDLLFSRAGQGIVLEFRFRHCGSEITATRGGWAVLAPPITLQERRKPHHGSASCRENVCQILSIQVVAGYVQKKKQNN